ncbi:MAG TPA: hypothetical protein VL282_14035 [Tepidisphaeraceae bacterium]|nr:hypothetical protein [Tepidisphaeraceae bacterium]
MTHIRSKEQDHEHRRDRPADELARDVEKCVAPIDSAEAKEAERVAGFISAPLRRPNGLWINAIAVDPIAMPMMERRTNGEAIARSTGESGCSRITPNKQAETMNAPRSTPSIA